MTDQQQKALRLLGLARRARLLEIGEEPVGIACRGGSCFIDPFGHEASETVWDREAIIYADLDMQQAIASRMEFDGVGHYARPDVLELRVHE